jgi:hypothetical protein
MTLRHIAAVAELQHERVHSFAHLLGAVARPAGLPREGKAGQGGHHHMEGLLLAILLNCMKSAASC